MSTEDESVAPGEVLLTSREAAVLEMILRQLTTEQRAQLAAVFSATARVPISTARVRQIESKLFSRIRIRVARGPHGPALRELRSKEKP